MSTLAIIHPTDLLAVELRESLDRRRDLWAEMLLFSRDDDDIGSLTEVRGTAAMVSRLDRGSLDNIDVAFFSSEMESNRQILADLPASTAAVVLSPDALAEDGHPIVGGVNLDQANRQRPMISPHPATILLAHILHPLHELGLRRVVATVLQPISMAGKSGLDEALGQTRSILSFDSDPPRQVFPFQMVFNIVPSQTPASQLESQLRTILDTEAPVSIHLIRAGVFHGFSASIYVELADDPGPETIRQTLAAHPSNEFAAKPESLGPVDAAASDKVLLGAVESVSEQAAGYRLWAVMDNLTCGGALNAIQILEAISSQVMH